MYDKNLYKRDVTCSLPPLPLSQTVTPSRTPSPSSVTYFMDGPKVIMIKHHFFAHFQILMEMGPEIYFSHFWYLIFDVIPYCSVYFQDLLDYFGNIFEQFIIKI